MRVLVTGATGFLGANLCHHLAARGDAVRILKRRTTPPTLLEGLSPEIVDGDLTDAASLVRATHGVEGVYHVAGLVSFWPPMRARQYQVNVEGTRRVLDAAVRNGVRRVVYTSSIGAVGMRADGLPSDEDTRWDCGAHCIHYWTTKLLAEHEVLQAAARGLDVTIVQPGLIFGPRDASWNSGRMFRMVAERAFVPVVAGTTTTCDVDDVCLAHIAAMERGRCGRCYILGGSTQSYASLMREIAAVMRRRVRVQEVPYPVARTAAWLLYVVSLLTRREPAITPELVRASHFRRTYSSERAIRELGYRQTPLRASLEKAYGWYRDHGLLA